MFSEASSSRSMYARHASGSFALEQIAENTALFVRSAAEARTPNLSDFGRVMVFLSWYRLVVSLLCFLDVAGTTILTLQFMKS